MPRKMQAAVVVQFGKPLVLQEWDTPSPGVGQIVVNTEACGVCHTDLHVAVVRAVPRHRRGRQLLQSLVALATRGDRMVGRASSVLRPARCCG